MSEIQEICKDISVTWHHCPGEDNPADFVSRGTTVVQLKERKWMAGPPSLMFKNSWPVEPSITPVDTEVRVRAIVATPEADRWWTRFSKWTRILAMVLNAFLEVSSVDAV